MELGHCFSEFLEVSVEYFTTHILEPKLTDLEEGVLDLLEASEALLVDQ